MVEAAVSQPLRVLKENKGNSRVEKFKIYLDKDIGLDNIEMLENLISHVN